jgi:hypothetical protein
MARLLSGPVSMVAQIVRTWTLPIASVAISLAFIPAPSILLRSAHVQAVGTALEQRAVELVQAPSAKLYQLAMLASAVGLELVANSIRNEQAPTASSPFADWRHALTVAGTANAYPSFAASEPQCALTSQLLVGIDSSSLVEQGVALTWAASADLDTARMGFLNLMLITAARECSVTTALQRQSGASTKR